MKAIVLVVLAVLQLLGGLSGSRSGSEVEESHEMYEKKDHRHTSLKGHEDVLVLQGGIEWVQEEKDHAGGESVSGYSDPLDGGMLWNFVLRG